MDRLLERIEQLDRRMYSVLRTLIFVLRAQKGLKMTLDELQVQVTANATVEASAVTLIQGLAAQLATVATDPAKVQALADQLKASADALGAAVVANTPAA